MQYNVYMRHDCNVVHAISQLSIGLLDQLGKLNVDVFALQSVTVIIDNNRAVTPNIVGNGQITIYEIERH